jgi:hypothetical protein
MYELEWTEASEAAGVNGSLRSAKPKGWHEVNASEIPIASPCGADWTTMRPSDRKRFCDTCKKHVHDLSAMSKDEARAVLASPPTEGLCVRFLYDEYGDVVFQKQTIAPSFLVRAKRLATYAVAAAIPATLTACMGAPAPVPVMMGAVACPMPPIPPPAPAAEEHRFATPPAAKP